MARQSRNHVAFDGILGLLKEFNAASQAKDQDECTAHINKAEASAKTLKEKLSTSEAEKILAKLCPPVTLAEYKQESSLDVQIIDGIIGSSLVFLHDSGDACEISSLDGCTTLVPFLDSHPSHWQRTFSCEDTGSKYAVLGTDFLYAWNSFSWKLRSTLHSSVSASATLFQSSEVVLAHYAVVKKFMELHAFQDPDSKLYPPKDLAYNKSLRVALSECAGDSEANFLSSYRSLDRRIGSLPDSLAAQFVSINLQGTVWEFKLLAMFPNLVDMMRAASRCHEDIITSLTKLQRYSMGSPDEHTICIRIKESIEQIEHSMATSSRIVMNSLRNSSATRRST